MAAGEKHSVILLQNGQVYAFGSFNCCGIVNIDGHNLTPIAVTIPNCSFPVTNIVCAAWSTLLQCKDGSWYAFGCPSQAKPAYGKEVTIKPSKLNSIFPISSTQKPIRVRKIVATYYCFFAISDENDLYVVGYNTNTGALGMGNTSNVNVWTKHPTVASADSFVDVQTGWHNAFVLYKY